MIPRANLAWGVCGLMPFLKSLVLCVVRVEPQTKTSSETICPQACSMDTHLRFETGRRVAWLVFGLGCVSTAAVLNRVVGPPAGRKTQPVCVLQIAVVIVLGLVSISGLSSSCNLVLMRLELESKQRTDRLMTDNNLKKNLLRPTQ